MSDSEDLMLSHFSKVANISCVQVVDESAVRFACPFGGCSVEADSVTKVNRHLQTRHENCRLSFRCFFCAEPRFLTSRTNFQLHLLKLHSNLLQLDVRFKFLRCPLCTVIVDREELLKRHVFNRHKISQYICVACVHQFAALADLLEHQAAVHGERLACQLCPFRPTTLVGAARHFYLNHHEERHFCRFCPKCFNNVGYLKIHENSDHCSEFGAEEAQKTAASGVQGFVARKPKISQSDPFLSETYDETEDYGGEEGGSTISTPGQNLSAFLESHLNKSLDSLPRAKKSSSSVYNLRLKSTNFTFARNSTKKYRGKRKSLKEQKTSEVSRSVGNLNLSEITEKTAALGQSGKKTAQGDEDFSDANFRAESPDFFDFPCFENVSFGDVSLAESTGGQESKESSAVSGECTFCHEFFDDICQHEWTAHMQNIVVTSADENLPILNPDEVEAFLSL